MRARLGLVVRLLKLALVLYVPLSFTVLPPPSAFHLVIGYTGAVLVVFFLDQASRSGPLGIAWNLGHAALAAATNGYFLLEIERLAMPLGMPPDLDYIVGIALLLNIGEASRRSLGWTLPVIALLLGIYVVAGASMPGVLYHPGVSFLRTINQLTGSLQGPHGQIPTIIVQTVTMFLVFGAVVQGAGIAEFFGSLANVVARRVRSGAGLTAVTMSSLFGAISGSPVANVGTTGAFTIPLMKRSGFKPEEAAGIEGVASTGSQIIPPILGTSAFIMAQFLNMPYSQIALLSLFPALLFVLTAMLTVHALGMRGQTRALGEEEVGRPRWTKAYLLLPVIALVWALGQGYSPEFAAFQATVAALAMFAAEFLLLRRWRAGGLAASARPMLSNLESAASAILMVVIAGAIIGIVVQLLLIPLTIQRMATLLIEAAGGSFLVITLVIAVASIILGTGLPTVATYVLVVLLFAPTLIELGVPAFAAHMFVFYLGVGADLTPPVAMSVLTACGIAGARFWPACWAAMKIGFSIFLLPFLFVLRPEIVVIPTEPADWLVWAAITAGVAAVVPVSTGYFFGHVTRPLRIGFLAVALLGIWPASGLLLPLGALAGFALCTAAVVATQRRAERERGASLGPSPSPRTG